MHVAAIIRYLAIMTLAVLAGCVVVEGPVEPDPQYCTREYAPVCARRGDDRRTFPNDCEAERAGYYVIRDGECRRDRPEYPDEPRPPRPGRPQACPMIYAPVCARRGNDRQTFDSACHADAAGYDVIRSGECGGGQMQPPGQPGTIPGGPGAVPGGPGASSPGGQPGASGPGDGGQTVCTQEYAPVCGVVGGSRQTFSNECVARAQGARRIRPGEC
nr:Kazal-type serine protease inhibitor [Mesorhizobium sp.]